MLFGWRIVEGHLTHLLDIGLINQKQIQTDQDKKDKEGQKRTDHINVSTGYFGDKLFEHEIVIL